MFCTKCGTKCDENAAFCTHCGAQVQKPLQQTDVVETANAPKPDIFSTASAPKLDIFSNASAPTQPDIFAATPVIDPFAPPSSLSNGGSLFSTESFNNSVNNAARNNSDSDGGSLAMGIISTVFGALYYLGIGYLFLIGIILGGIAISRTSYKIKLKVKYAKGGFVLGIIGLSLCGLGLLLNLMFL